MESKCAAHSEQLCHPGPAALRAFFEKFVDCTQHAAPTLNPVTTLHGNALQHCMAMHCRALATALMAACKALATALMAFLLVRLAKEGSAQALDDKDEIQAEHDDAQGPAGKNKLHALVSAGPTSCATLENNLMMRPPVASTSRLQVSTTSHWPTMMASQPAPGRDRGARDRAAVWQHRPATGPDHGPGVPNRRKPAPAAHTQHTIPGHDKAQHAAAAGHVRRRVLRAAPGSMPITRDPQ